MEKWRFLDTGENTGILNMAIDEAIFNLKVQELTPPTLRVYTWKPACLSLGRRQKIIDVDFNQCKKLEIDVVRRPTGGAAVLHKTELTYSAVLYNQTYEAVCQGLKTAYKMLGVDLGGGFKQIDSPNCFLSKGLTDLTYNDKKLIGSVQSRKDRVILQHGSLVIKHHPEILFSVLKSTREEYRTFAENTTSLSEIIGDVDLAELKRTLLEGFGLVFNVDFTEGNLTEKEIQETEKLIKKYEKLEWP